MINIIRNKFQQDIPDMYVLLTFDKRNFDLLL
jgi:hypothetical protein